MELKNIIFMKYGTHAGATPEAIINSKINEVSLSGTTFWGYGGNVCHPTKQIQPFILASKSRGEKTYLVLSQIESVWAGVASPATFYSYDKAEWIPIPESNTIVGSRFALMCTSFELCDFMLDLAYYQVPIGEMKGRLLSNYICGHITKGCGVLSRSLEIETQKAVRISAVAEVSSAVFLR